MRSVSKYVSVINLIEACKTELEKISKDNLLALDLSEMEVIQEYFKSKGRNPTDIELETIAQTWSEHCKHKTFTAVIEYIENGRKKKVHDNLLKTLIFRVTKELNKKWCISVFRDNAGIIEFNKEYGVAFKVETHNHPSAIEPYGGAGTGIGGVIRDILGVGLGAKPIMNTDVFCFGPLDFDIKDLPEGVLHPKRIFKGVVKGVSDYGNRMGIPTANGAVLFDERYICNPLVYCGTIGIIPKDKCFKKVVPGDLIVAVGGRTGRDGIHGATFSSLALDKDTESSCVQIGNPITEKKILDVILQARDKNLYNAITDCGAGGFSSAVGELGAGCGARVYLDDVPLKYEGLLPWEIWISEAQERMVLSVPKKNIKELLRVLSSEDVEATIIGEFTNTKKLEIYYKKNKICDLDMDFLHHGVPRKKLKAVWRKLPCTTNIVTKNNPDLSKVLHETLSSPNICSKEWVIRQYDFEVQAQTIIKPLVGKRFDGPSDATVIHPIVNIPDVYPKSEREFKKENEDFYKGIVVSNGICPKYSRIDTYWMAASAIEEALRNLICVGGNLNHTALLDNFSWGNAKDEFQLGLLVRACQACYDFVKIYGTPFISGKDSLNNEFVDKDGKRLQVLPTLLISAISVIKDVRKVITMDLKSPGNSIYVLGITKDEGLNINPPSVPKLNAKKSKLLLSSLSKAINKGLVKSCHDCSEGGIAVTGAEMCFSGELGMKIDLSLVPVEFKFKENHTDFTILFSESNSRFIVEVPPENESEFKKILKGCTYKKIGTVTEEKYFTIYGINKKIILKENIFDLKESWQKTLKNL